MAQFDTNEIDLNLVQTNIHEQIKKAAASVQILLDERNGEPKFELDAKHPEMKIDQLHFANIIRNLLDNAIKYCAENPKILIQTSDSKNGITIKVSDNGIGIDSTRKKQVFEKFFRVPTGNVHNVKGFGLGLYYVKTLIEAHNGTVDVTSSLNGSTFIIFLPYLK